METKKRITEKYELTPVLRQTVFNGLDVRCCCGNRIADTYYFFLATHRETGEKRGLYAGSDCSLQLIRLAGLKPLPLFDLFGRGNRKWCSTMSPLSRDLYVAINFLVSSWGGRLKPDGRLVGYLLRLAAGPDIPALAEVLKGFAQILAKDRAGRSLVRIVAGLRERNPSMPWYDFGPLAAAFRECFGTDQLIFGRSIR
ncbi:MAG TPA: hypothetical protein VI298_15975 [Geobacteraceae bacterium]